jgi:abortive infection bacteriophage resistance protein
VEREAQVDQLIDRGMQVPDRGRALPALAHLNDYRIGAYWLPFEADHDSHTFGTGADFEHVLELYSFARERRILLLDAIERVEVSVRTQFAYRLSHRAGTHAHEDAGGFTDSAHDRDHFGQLKRELDRSAEPFVSHDRNRYHTPKTPPIWATCEVMSFGLLSKFLTELKPAHQKSITRAYALPAEILPSVVQHLAYVRNLCAHHARLWNREFTIIPEYPRKRPQSLRDRLISPHGRTTAQDHPARRLYNTLMYLIDRLSIITPDDPWPGRLNERIDNYRVDREDMGYPPDFRSRPVWRNAGR